MIMMIVEAVRMMVMICRKKEEEDIKGRRVWITHILLDTHIDQSILYCTRWPPSPQHYVFRRLSVTIICEKISLDTYDAGASKAKDHWSARACDQCLVTPFDAICRRCHLNCGKTLGDRKKFQSVLSVTFSPPPRIHHKNYVLDSKKIQSGLKI